MIAVLYASLAALATGTAAWAAERSYWRLKARRAARAARIAAIEASYERDTSR